MYSLDGMIFQLILVFLGLSVGIYEIMVMDELGCLVIEIVEVEEWDDLLIIIVIILC